jgi:UDP-4-amino-4,6-dideoxy-N-acetyl-beta-L-altrosamine N-acetyltransferase
MSVRLRPFEQGDARRVFDWRNSEDVARWMYRDGPIPANEHGRWIYALLSEADEPEPSRLYWIIEVDAAPVGVANLVRIDRANGKADWAYYLADPAVRGRGVGAAVEYAVIDHAFGALGLEKLWCEVLVENTAVIALHESFGFQREALYRRHVRKDGVARDAVGLGLLAQDWAKVAPACRDRLAARDAAPATIIPA